VNWVIRKLSNSLPKTPREKEQGACILLLVNPCRLFKVLSLFFKVLSLFFEMLQLIMG